MATAWAFAAIYFPALQIAPLYLWRSQPRSQTIYQRMGITAAAAMSAAWVPTARRLAAEGGEWQDALLPALGLRLPGLLAACALPLALTALLFAGHLLALAGSVAGSTSRVRELREQRWSLPTAVRLRNWAAAPLLEELIYRACLISYLQAAGASAAACIWLSPLLFAASHLHHLHDLTRFQGLPLGRALAAVAFQLSYTTPFGWLAACYFVRTRHLAAAVLPHAFCNFVGPPAPPPAESSRLFRAAVAAAYACGIAAFFCLLGPLTQPALYGNAGS